jgi:hypothetical protein
MLKYLILMNGGSRTHGISPIIKLNSGETTIILGVRG